MADGFGERYDPLRVSGNAPPLPAPADSPLDPAEAAIAAEGKIMAEIAKDDAFFESCSSI